MKPLRVLVVEDDPEDLLLMELELQRGGFAPQVLRVETAEEMREALVRGEWDVILSDYILPLFSAPAALKVLQEVGLDIPFIVLSGSVGEQYGVEMMRAGARDYFPKDRITRLGAAVSRELAEAEARRARARAEVERALLARLGEVLTAPLDFEQRLNQLVRLPVPSLADSCAIFLDGDGRELRMAALAHEQPAADAWQQVPALYARLGPECAVGPAHVLHSGRPELLPDVSEPVEQLAREDARWAVLLALNLRSILYVPCVATMERWACSGWPPSGGGGWARRTCRWPRSWPAACRWCWRTRACSGRCRRRCACATTSSRWRPMSCARPSPRCSCSWAR